MPSENLISMVGEFGALGFVFWMAWRLANHTIPRLAKQFETATEKQRQDFKEILAQQRETFHEMIKREREVHGQHVQHIVDAIRCSQTTTTKEKTG